MKTNHNNTTEDLQVDIVNSNNPDLVTSILNVTINGVFALQAIYNNKGAIADFTLLKINKPFAAMLQMDEEDIIGKSYLQLLPHSGDNGLFETKCQVVQTGKTVNKEIYYDSVGK